MPDLLTHVLVMYVARSVLAWYVDGVERHHVPLGMAGALIPDVAKAYFVLGSTTVGVLGVRFSWLAVQTIGVASALAAFGALWVSRRERVPALGLLLGGVWIHVALDLLVVRADGTAPPYLYPLTWMLPPSGDVYLSSDLWPSVVLVALSALVLVRNRRKASP